MQKHYLLLRNNQQSGPFTIDELLQQHLTPSDLVWVEDQSRAWAFPYEIEELRFAAAGAAAAKRGQRHIYVSYPARPIPWMERKSNNTPKPEPSKSTAESGPKLTAGDLERKAEELRQRALSWKPTEYYPSEAEEEQEHVGYSSYERPIHYEFHRRKRYVTLEHLMVVGLVSVMAVAAWYRGWAPLRSKMNTIEQTVTPLVSVDNHAAKRNPLPHANAQMPAQNNQPSNQLSVVMLSAPDTAANASVALTDKPHTEIIKKKKPTPKTLPQIAIKPEITQPQKEELMIPPSTPAADDKKDVAATDVKPNESAEKKKEHRGFLGALFKKKKKEGNAGQATGE
jgi:hypothetical protein